MLRRPGLLEHNSKVRALLKALSTPFDTYFSLEDNVMAEALALRNMTQLQTPLLGDENTPLRPDPGFGSATPRHQVAFTPNPLATPLHQGGGDPSATPRANGTMPSATPLRTPMRDGLSLNAADRPRVGETPRELRMHANEVKRSLQQGFASLPAPKNDFELDVENLGGAEEDDETVPMTEEDAAERDARIKRRKEEAERRALERRSMVVKRGLPRPVNIDRAALIDNLAAIPAEDPSLADAKRLVDEEFAALLEHDTIAHPLPGTKYPGSTESAYIHPDDQDVALARALITNEVAAMLDFPVTDESRIGEALAILARDEDVGDVSDWASTRDGLVYDTQTKRWVDPSTLSEDERKAGLAALLQQDRDEMSSEASKAIKLEKKLGKILGGYQARFEALSKRLGDSFEQLDKTSVELESFSLLNISESAAIPRRVQGLSEEVDRLERRERTLQERYRELDTERRELLASIALKEERMMAEAEALNDEALAEMDAAQ